MTARYINGAEQYLNFFIDYIVRGANVDKYDELKDSETHWHDLDYMRRNSSCLDAMSPEYQSQVLWFHRKRRAAHSKYNLVTKGEVSC